MQPDHAGKGRTPPPRLCGGLTMERTQKERDAVDLDVMVFRTIIKLLQFADDHNDMVVRGIASDLGSMRHRFRKHMELGETQ